MEKLIELLNECKGKSYRFGVNGDNSIYQKETDAYGNIHIIVLPDYKLISKQFGFIKWLVENDKIDNKKIADETYVKVNGELYEVILGCHYDLYQQTLMLLSISDTPIEDLISYLK